jgi:hypothetical protein
MTAILVLLAAILKYLYVDMYSGNQHFLNLSERWKICRHDAEVQVILPREEERLVGALVVISLPACFAYSLIELHPKPLPLTATAKLH